MCTCIHIKPRMCIHMYLYLSHLFLISDPLGTQQHLLPPPLSTLRQKTFCLWFFDS